MILCGWSARDGHRIDRSAMETNCRDSKCEEMVALEKETGVSLNEEVIAG